MPPTLSVLIPALNEAANLRAAVRGVLGIVDQVGLDAEVIILSCFDKNGSGDGTVEVARRLAAEDRRVSTVHVDGYQSLGMKFRAGILLASGTHLILIPGDNEFVPASMKRVFEHIGRADMILCYTANPEIRPWHRRIASGIYIHALNILFFHRIKYYNGTNVYRTEDLRQVLPGTDSFAVLAEIVLRLLHAEKTYIEIPVLVQPRQGHSKAFKLDHAIRVILDILKLRLGLGSQ